MQIKRIPHIEIHPKRKIEKDLRVRKHQVIFIITCIFTINLKCRFVYLFKRRTKSLQMNKKGNENRKYHLIILNISKSPHGVH